MRPLEIYWSTLKNGWQDVTFVCLAHWKRIWQGGREREEAWIKGKIVKDNHVKRLSIFILSRSCGARTVKPGLNGSASSHLTQATIACPHICIQWFIFTEILPRNQGVGWTVFELDLSKSMRLPKPLWKQTDLHASAKTALLSSARTDNDWWRTLLP